MKRVYVCGASAEVDMVKAYCDTLESRGWSITYRWVDDVIEHRDKGIPDSELSDEERHLLASRDEMGVLGAEIVWLLVPPVGRSVGAWIELGIAFGAGKNTIMSGDHERTIFGSLASLRFATHDEALAWLGEAS